MTAKYRDLGLVDRDAEAPGLSRNVSDGLAGLNGAAHALKTGLDAFQRTQNIVMASGWLGHAVTALQ